MRTISGKIEQFIARRLYKIQQAAGLEIYQSASGEFRYRLAVVRRNAGEAELVAVETALDSLESVATRLAKEAIPVFVVLNIRGIIHQANAAGAGQTAQKILNTLLPDADPEQFLTQFEASQHLQVTSLARRDTVLELLEQLRAHGIWVLGLGFGPLTAGLLSAFLPPGTAVATQMHTLFYDEKGELARFERTSAPENQSIRIGSAELDSRLAPAYGAALWCLLDRGPLVDDVEIQKNRLEHLHLSLFLRGRWVALGVLLGLLVANTLFYLHYKDKSRDLNADLAGKTTALSQLDSMREQVVEQKSLMDKTFLNQASRTSFFADRIAASLPDDITLTELFIYPARGREEDYTREELVIFQSDLIRIKGTCRGSESYNRWTQYLERQKWTLGIRHLHYADISLDKGAFEFGLIVSPSGTFSAPRSTQSR